MVLKLRERQKSWLRSHDPSGCSLSTCIRQLVGEAAEELKSLQKVVDSTSNQSSDSSSGEDSSPEAIGTS